MTQQIITESHLQGPVSAYQPLDLMLDCFMTERECCQIGLTYKLTGKRDTTSLRTAAIQHRNSPYNVEKMMIVLKDDPAIIDGWELWSGDKRWSPGWYFEKSSPTDCVVGYYHSETDKQIKTTLRNEFRACALFILRELDDYLDIIESRS